MADRTTQLFKGISIQTLVTFVMGVMEIVVFAVMSRLLSKTDFGYYATLTALVSIVASISEAGLGSAVIQKKESSSRHLGTAFTLSVILGFSAAILLAFTAPLLARLVSDDTIILPMRLMSVMLFLNSIISIGRGILMRKLKFLTVGIISIVAYAVSSVIGIVMALHGMGLYAVVGANVLNVFIGALLYLFSPEVKVPKLAIYKQEAKEVVSFGGWLTLGVILNNITQQVDKLLLPRLASVTLLGAYNRPAGFVNTITDKINGIFDTVLFPMLSGLQDDKQKVELVFNKAVSLLNSFSVVLAAIFFFNAELIITLFFGANWLDLVPVLRIIAVSSIFLIDGRLVDCFFRSLGLVKLGFQLRVVGAVVSFAAVVIGARFGIVGVAIALLIANVSIILLKVVVLAIRIDANVWGVLSRLLVAMKSSIPLAVVGVPFVLLVPSPNWLVQSGFALLFACVIVYEFLCQPRWIGLEYVNTVYPRLVSLKQKFLKR